MDKVRLYAGSVPDWKQYEGLLGLTPGEGDSRHIHCDIRERHPFDDNSVDYYQAEDVFEHIEYDLLPGIIDDIYRILKPGGLFRLSVPDYRCDILLYRSLRNALGIIQDDPGLDHLWFPRYETVVNLLLNSNFNFHVLHGYTPAGDAIIRPIDYSLGYIQRTPDHDARVRNPYRPMSIVVDCYKM